MLDTPDMLFLGGLVFLLLFILCKGSEIFAISILSQLTKISDWFKSRRDS